MKLLSSLRLYLVAALVAAGLGGVVLAQNAGQFLFTPLGNELIRVLPAGSATDAYVSIASIRDGRMWVYNVPLTGFTLTMTDLQSVVSLNPAGTLAAGTIVLPPTLVDGKTATIFSSQIITALTLSTSNSATFVPAAPTTLAANSPIAFVYDKANNQWHRFD